MTKKLKLELGGVDLDFPVRRLFVAGYTGRDSKLVGAHIAELKRLGIPPPERVPALYPVDPSWATLDSDITVGARQVSGEAEPALLFQGDTLGEALVSVSVDFTDREAERQSIPRSKELPKPLASRVWRYSDVSAMWDEIALRGWAEPGSRAPLYQSGKLKELQAPAELLGCLRPELGERLEGTVLLMGTLPLRVEAFSFTDYFACELEAPDHSILGYQCRICRPSPAAGAV